MYVHIGENKLILSSEIIAIIDKKTFEYHHANQKFLQDGKRTENIAGKIYKSIVITNDKIYLSPFTTHTIKKRFSFL
ncbi:extracellular matrix regulator RemB [Fervidibacillus halotolerans]|uniref:DUF370 domain-containing protein n=1 Tax=Fervidibacillus halotolerans TaxID=2980027 RepID=A0A9E8S061_9BACI|nr:extracellular matrix/biofilm biosynthesis regulator RemA family protein [Fervidibacillus halotolerans]WAA12302.1 DUF370 domain-containing protein [Fervidibacillus halotolerans]